MTGWVVAWRETGYLLDKCDESGLACLVGWLVCLTLVLWYSLVLCLVSVGWLVLDRYQSTYRVIVDGGIGTTFTLRGEGTFDELE